jgi:6-phosphogluconolactonase/glucosamine-6-phosphate isomerase/deaminase
VLREWIFVVFLEGEKKKAIIKQILANEPNTPYEVL